MYKKLSIKLLFAFFSMLYLLYSLSVFDTLPKASATSILTYNYQLDGTSSSLSQSFSIPKIYQVQSITTNNGSVSTSVNVNSETVTVSGSGGSYYSSYTPSTSCSTSIGPQSSSSFPSSTSCSSGGMSGSVSASGGPSSSTTTYPDKSISGSCSNTQNVSYDSTGSGTVSFSGSCPGSYPYSDSDGYSGTLNRGSTSPSSGCGSSGPPNSSCSTTFTASYSGTATKSSTTSYTQSYSGTVYGSTIYYYRYTGTITYVTNGRPVLTITNPTQAQRVSAVSGYNVITISGYVSDEDSDTVTISASISGITKTWSKANVTTNPSGDSWSLTWTLPSDNVAAGSYSNIVISASDGKSGGDTDTYTGTITVDKTPPTLSPVTIASNNTNTTLAKPGDVITINFTASEPLLTTPVVTILGNPATVSLISGNSYKATYTGTSSDSDGIVPFSINFTDVVGNNGTTVTNTTNSSKVTFDKTPPGFSVAHISSSNANPTIALAGDTVTLTFTVSESILSAPTAVIAGHAVTVTSLGGSNYKATYTMVNGDPGGKVTFTVTLKDLAGNIGTPNDTTDGSYVTYNLFIITPTSGSYKINSGTMTNITITSPNKLAGVKFADSPSVTQDEQNIIYSMQASIGTSTVVFDTDFLNLVAIGSYQVILMDNYSQTKTYTLQITPSALVISPTSGIYVQGSGSTLYVSDTTKTNFASSNKSYLKFVSGNVNQVYFDPTLLDSQPIGNQTVTFTDAYGQTAQYTLTIKASTAAPAFSPNNGTYLIGSGTPLSTTAPSTIGSVSSTNLNAADWSFSGKTITLNPSQLDKESLGVHVIRAVLTDGTVIYYNLNITSNNVITARWTQNTNEFNKNTTSSEYEDLVLTYSAPVISVNSLTIGTTNVPSTAYSVTSNSVIISKTFLATLPDKDPYKVYLTFNTNGSVIFQLTVTSILPPSNSNVSLPCV
jgi:hypothetical protein